MARRQLQITGTERKDVPPELDEAGETWLEMRREKRRVADKAKEAKAGVLMLMQMHKVKKYTVKDPESEEILELQIDLEPKLRTKKTGEAGDGEVGEGIPAAPESSPGIHPGLIAQAEKAQADAGVEETPEGDVVPVTDASVPRKPRKGGAKKKGKRK
jgi:hypothetical protein